MFKIQSSNDLALESTNGRVVTRMRNVSNADLVEAFTQMVELAKPFACPIIFVNGTGYTSFKTFLEDIEIANDESREQGGIDIFPK